MLMKRANSDGTSVEDLIKPREIQSSCNVCQREADEPLCFRVTMPHEDIGFNRTVSLDLMKLAGKAVLHIVD